MKFFLKLFTRKAESGEYFVEVQAISQVFVNVLEEELIIITVYWIDPESKSYSAMSVATSHRIGDRSWGLIHKRVRSLYTKCLRRMIWTKKILIKGKKCLW
ncbi:hypothetical protein XENOCAPTIV_023161 [Xenoophorus captivus]|uniref:Uncharacterized protein n=1 Tax=Xenoophorus captivus TaxID=1517983 RepID=A0ABV0SB21_9TELE